MLLCQVPIRTFSNLLQLISSLTVIDLMRKICLLLGTLGAGKMVPEIYNINSASYVVRAPNRKLEISEYTIWKGRL